MLRSWRRCNPLMWWSVSDSSLLGLHLNALESPKVWACIQSATGNTNSFWRRILHRIIYLNLHSVPCRLQTTKGMQIGSRLVEWDHLLNQLADQAIFSVWGLYSTKHPTFLYLWWILANWISYRIYIMLGGMLERPLSPLFQAIILEELRFRNQNRSSFPLYVLYSSSHPIWNPYSVTFWLLRTRFRAASLYMTGRN